MTYHNTSAGMAALSICEALLLALDDAAILPAHEIRGILEDAATTHLNVPETDPQHDAHRAAAKLIAGIIASGHSVRHT